MQSEIKINVTLDANKIPEKISWTAQGMEDEEAKDASAFLLSIWDPRENNLLRIDLWTKDMTVDEMKQFYYQAFITMSETFERATGEKEITTQMVDFAEYFAEKMGLTS
jgi:gliding motility-associated protein GldC